MNPTVILKKLVFGSPLPLIGLWLIGGLITIIVPVRKQRTAADTYYNYYGKAVEYENNQRAYEEAQKEYEEAQNGNYNNNQNNNQQYSMSNCKWWDGGCRKNAYYYQMAQDDGGDDYNQPLPNWYLTLGGKMDEEGNRDQQEQGQSSDQAPGAIKFVYTITIITFVALLGFGSFVMYKKTSPVLFYAMLGVFGVTSLMQMVLLTQGVISSDDRELENSIYGWYGQLAVLMVYTNWGYFLFSVIFGSLFGIKAFLEYKLLNTEDATTAQPAASIAAKDLDEGSYKNMA
mmetsp:Transcript_16097/g.21045  ORF Transcript_16097/g.21045 Transcript_16097/m.21045 type:complete len:287 (-) Transcript_16097:228-1088(-)|eukprot:CAMPEP_0198142442 /NCGR_PEP_ID=MMETSP1443-20131203/5230_1 /TAXON_ID=186043 /ORGANISM="Entomoneis sp., Strain CCMP2396" /LENGTH=286 /DNA_ID=CAMNT_0043805449 /DNA_START=73 /DNA_END=933 /DNA_ORIENTATION=+